MEAEVQEDDGTFTNISLADDKGKEINTSISSAKQQTVDTICS